MSPVFSEIVTLPVTLFMSAVAREDTLISPSKEPTVTEPALAISAAPLPFILASFTTSFADSLLPSRFTSRDPAEPLTFISPCACEAVRVPLIVSALMAPVFWLTVRFPVRPLVISTLPALPFTVTLPVRASAETVLASAKANSSPVTFILAVRPPSGFSGVIVTFLSVSIFMSSVDVVFMSMESAVKATFPKPDMSAVPPIVPVVEKLPPASSTLASPFMLAIFMSLLFVNVTSTDSISAFAVILPCASAMVSMPSMPMPVPLICTWPSVCPNVALPLSVSMATFPPTEPASKLTVEPSILTSPATLPTFTEAASVPTGETLSMFTLSRSPAFTLPPSATVETSTLSLLPSMETDCPLMESVPSSVTASRDCAFSMLALPSPATFTFPPIVSAVNSVPESVTSTSLAELMFMFACASATVSLPSSLSTWISPVFVPITALPWPFIEVWPTVAVSALRFPPFKFTSTEPAETERFMSPCASETLREPPMVSALMAPVF